MALSRPPFPIVLMPRIRQAGGRSRYGRSGGRQPLTNESCPVGAPPGDRLVTEIIARVMEPGTRAVSSEDHCARALVQHEGEILAAHCWRPARMDACLAGNLTRRACGM